ncbi:FAD-dependent monooxygenase [Oceaniglobus trochenteri]|uniref:FAD-dependent monooxygenase n=1 Tax=Oceaniglobus trochenteri TaxID=2763260 RepID=UPI001CFF8DFD|nr:FAD-dependent monooxygenase [Oceaniglobus trochenteri]
MTPLQITVLGGGIAGLACATALARAGQAVRVFERADELGEVGAGLQLSGNGMAVLRALDMGGAIRERSGGNHAVKLRVGATGARLIAMDMSPDDFRFIHRADLIDVLADGAIKAGVDIQTGRAVSAVALTDRGATLSLADGGQVDTGLVIGADGVRSVLRPVVNGAGQPFFTGQVAWRALIPGTQAPPEAEAEVFVGPGRHLVRYPLPARGLINLVGVEEREAWAEESWHSTGDPKAFRAAFSGFCERLRRDLDAVTQVNLWGLFRHPVADRWHRGAGVLIGDAAHPTLPFLAQGANLALEDAFVLADCLSHHPVDKALALYQQRRDGRVRRAIAAANANARNYHLSHWWQTGPAHTALRLLDRTAPRVMADRFRWLYDHDVTAPR